VTATLCASCRAPLGDDAVICSRCMGGLLRDLGDVAAVSVELDVTLSRISRMTSGAMGVREPEDTWTLDRPELGVEVQPHPFHGGASVARDGLRNALTTSVRLLVDDPDGWPADTLPALAAWLMCRAEEIRHHAGALDLATVVWDAMRACERAIDMSPTRTRIHVGPCPETVDGKSCVGEVHALFPMDEGQEARMECNVCGAAYAPVQWTRAGERIMQERERRAG
jgi:hypothetical protein